MKLAIVVFNLGGPDGPGAVRPFLFNLFNDPAIITLPGIVRRPLAAFIARRRETVAQANYDLMGGASPLLPETQSQARALEAELKAQAPGVDARVFVAMRYWKPFAADTAKTVAAFAPDEIVLLPLYPQYSTTTTASVEDRVDAWQRRNPQVTVSLVQDYSIDPDWVAAVAGSIQRYWQQQGRGQKLMFSFHGIPQRLADAGDPYPQRCEASARAIAAALGLGADDWQMGYQSRFGRERWLQPYAEPSLWELAEAGVKQIDVVCPGFATDCLETLEEVAMGFTETLAERGAQMRYIPCLNAEPEHARALARLAVASLA